MLPKVQLVALLLCLPEQLIGGGVSLAPDKGTRIGVRVPAGFQAENVAGDMPFAKLFQERQDFLLAKLRRSPIPYSQAPHRRKVPASGIQIVPLNRLPHVGAGEDVHIDAPCRWDIHAHELGSRFAWTVKFPGARGNLLSGRRFWTNGSIAHGIQIAEIETGIPGRVHIDAVPASGHIERHRRVGIAQDRALIVANPNGFLPSQQLERSQVHAEAIELLPRL